MTSKHRPPFAAALALVLAMLACNLPSGPATSAPPTATLQPILTVEPTQPPTETPVPATPTTEPTSTTAPSPTSNVVTFSASGGNIFIRRGPGVGYNPLAIFKDGQSAVALARNEDGSWLNISLPGAEGQTGWINAKTQFSRVSGDASLLPVTTIPAPEAAYIRNCTFHEMLVKPADVKVPGQSYSPDNKVQFNPGEYEVFDTTNDKSVKTISLREGDKADIKKDGLGNSYTCP